MRVKFWGVRGSIPTPAQAPDPENQPPAGSIRPVGGNTPCVEVRHEGALIVLDAGSGLRLLGLELGRQAAPGESGPDIRLLMSHTHWDHLQGFPFFAPAYDPSAAIAVYGRSAGDLSRAFELQQTAPSMFPCPLDGMGAKISFHSFPAEGLSFGRLSVRAFRLPHPGGSLAFRLSAAGRSVVYATDYEFQAPDSPEADDFAGFIKNADILISDAQFVCLEDGSRKGWGHSTSFEAVDLAMRGGVAALYMFHHDPNHSDAGLFERLEKTRAYYAMMSGGGGMAIELATEGAVVEL